MFIRIFCELSLSKNEIKVNLSINIIVISVKVIMIIMNNIILVENLNISFEAKEVT